MPRNDRFEQVLAAARDGAEWAWRDIYLDLAPAVHGYLRSQGAPHPEDTTSEVFARLVRDLDSFTGSAARFRSWVFSIAHARLIDARRKVARRRTDPAEVTTLDRYLPPTEAEPAAVDQLTTEEVGALFRALTADQRSVLMLRIVAGLTLSETAEAMAKTSGAVKALQHRALKALRAELGEDLEVVLPGVVALPAARR